MEDPSALAREVSRLKEQNSALRRELTDARTVAAIDTADGATALPMVLWSIDSDGLITLSEGAGLGSLGLEPRQLVGKNVFEVYNNNEEALEPIRRALQGEEVAGRAVVGESRWENRYFPRVKNGEVVGLFGISIDVTAQRLAEQARLHVDRLWRSIAENAPDYIMVIDREHRIVLANRYTTSSASQVFGKKIYEFFDEDQHSFARREVEAAFAGETGRSFESSSEVAPGGRRWFENRIAAVLEHGEVTGVVIVSTDVSEKIKAARERKQLEVQIQHRQKLESLGVLAGGIAHDFNNLLVSMLGHADLARLEIAEAHPAGPHIHEIESAASRAADLCTQMLAYSGKANYELQDLHLSQLTKEIAQLLAVSVGKQVSLERNLDPELWLIEADRAQVQQVIMNLITNASDAVGPRAGTVALETGCGTFGDDRLRAFNLVHHIPAGDYVFLEVSDTGCGMTEDTRLRMFDPFFTTKASGRGLGMASVLGIVRGHGGGIGVTSEVDGGTRIRLFLPRKVGGNTTPSDTKVRHGAANDLGGGRTLLVVDDEASVRRVACKMLAILGFETIEAENGRQAVEIYKSHDTPIAAVLLDLTMPVMGGVEAAERLTRFDPDARILLTSGYSEDELPESSVEMLRKPYLLADIRSAVERLLDSTEPPDS